MDIGQIFENNFDCYADTWQDNNDTIPPTMTQEFNEWMAKIGNIYYADDNRMAKAFKIIDEYEKV